MFGLQKGCIRDSYMQAVARLIWFLAAIYDIKLEYCNIVGVHNVKADVLSRMFERGFTYLHMFKDSTWWQVQGAHFYPNVFI